MTDDNCELCDDGLIIKKLKTSLRLAINYSREYTEGCLYCGDINAFDDKLEFEISEKHKKNCWYYQAEKLLGY